MAIRAALLGTGIFSKDVYAKIFSEQATRVQLHTVWSRSQSSAEEFASKHASTARITHGEQGLSTILHDPEIDLVVVVLPVQGALEVVNRALAAGKHVIEEKPVAGTLEEAVASIKLYRSNRSSGSPAASGLWMLAENYRYEQVFHDACAMAPSVLGTLIKLDLVVNLPMDTANKYYNSQWRRSPGVMITESSVHFIAALRMMTGACGLGEAKEVASRTFHAKPDLSGPDSVVGVVAFEKGAAPASVSISLAASNVDFSLKACGTEGVIEVTRGGWGGSRASYSLTWKGKQDTEPQTKSYTFTGVATEFSSFLDLVSSSLNGGLMSVLGTPEELRGSPEEGARDLALVQALLESGAQGGSVVKVKAI